MVKRIARRVGIVLAVLVTLRIVLAFIWPTINDVTTGATPEYPDLQPQTFQQTYEPVFDAVAAVARAQGWDVAEADPASGLILYVVLRVRTVFVNGLLTPFAFLDWKKKGTPAVNPEV